MNTKQTAIEWLVNKITTEHDKSFSEFYGAEIQQAKEMEDNALQEKYNEGYYEGYNSGSAYYPD